MSANKWSFCLNKKCGVECETFNNRRIICSAPVSFHFTFSSTWKVMHWIDLVYPTPNDHISVLVSTFKLWPWYCKYHNSMLIYWTVLLYSSLFPVLPAHVFHTITIVIMWVTAALPLSLESTERLHSRYTFIYCIWTYLNQSSYDILFKYTSATVFLFKHVQNVNSECVSTGSSHPSGRCV